MSDEVADAHAQMRTAFAGLDVNIPEDPNFDESGTYDTGLVVGGLVGELHQIVWGLHSIGLAFADPYDPVAASQIAALAQTLAGQITRDDDDGLAAQTCSDVMNLLWPHCAPEECGQADWWQTPLGAACARCLGRDDAESVSQSIAAAMLGVTRGTVAQLVARGTLDRHPDGGVLRSSVLARVARLNG